jgi:carbon-monoxide dehydrogenase medium subunit
LKAPAFAYAKPASLAEAFALLENPGAKVLAGGQSLIPSLNMRLSSPELLVDIGGLKELRKIEPTGNVIRIGALVTHAMLENEKRIPLLAEAAKQVAHAAIRNRGTIGGSLALADPAAEYPAVAVALEALLVVCGKSGERKIPAAKFFKSLFETDLRPGELLTAVEFPVARPADKSVFLELTRRTGDYAIVGLAVHNERFVFFGVGAVPFLLKGGSKEALKKELKPTADLYNTASTKLHLAGVLLDRAWNTLKT